MVPLSEFAQATKYAESPFSVQESQEVPDSPLVDLMELADAAISASEKVVVAKDTVKLREASLGLAGTLAYQPLRSAYKRRVGERLADENLLFWAHAKDFEMTARRRDNSSEESLSKVDAAMNLDDILSTSASSDKGLSVGDPTFEAALVCMAQETVSKYLNKKGSRRIGVGQGAATEAEVRRVSQEVGDTVRATTEARSSNSFTSKGGAAPKPPPPPAPKPKAIIKGPRACSVCTFVNEKPEAIVCELCSSKLPEHAEPPPESSTAMSMDDMLSGVASTPVPAPSVNTGFKRDNPGAMFVFSGLADSVFRYMESSDDFLEFSSSKSDTYRKLLLAVPAHARANRRGQSNPLSLRVLSAVVRGGRNNTTSSVSSDSLSVSGSLGGSGVSNLDSLMEDESLAQSKHSHSAPRSSFFGASMMTNNNRASNNSIDKGLGARTMSSRLLGSRAKTPRQREAEEKANVLAKKEANRQTSSLTLPQKEDMWVQMREEEMLSCVSLEMIRESEDSRTRCFSDPSLMSPNDLRKNVGALPDGQSWPDLCWSGIQAKALLKGSLKDMREAQRLEETSTAGVIHTYQWWRTVCASKLVAAQSKARQRSSSLSQQTPPQWSPCYLEAPQRSNVEETEWLQSLLLNYEKKTRQIRLARWSQASSAHGSTHVAARHAIGGLGTVVSASGLSRFGKCDSKTLDALSRIPGRLVFYGAVRCVWRKGQGSTTPVSYGGLTSGTESSELEGWTASDRLNTFNTFTANAAKYICVLSEVYDNLPISVAASESGMSQANTKGRRDSTAGSKHIGSRCSTLSFIRARSGRLERVIHLHDLVWVAPALKPLHALCLGDVQGECLVMLPGFSGPDVSGADTAATCRDIWFDTLSRAGGQRIGSHKLVHLPYTEGVVKKKGGGAIQRWQSRRFVLDYSAQTMRYYDEASGEMKGSIPLSTVEHVTPGNDTYFTLVSKPTEKTPKKGKEKEKKGDKSSRVWDLQAASREEMIDWVNAIEQCLIMRKQQLRAQQAMQSQVNNPNALSGGKHTSSRGLRTTRKK
mmetsp:Transcript_6918/g.8942  ORF Transcript_6918/g.8942 Transcript_6918/m.8942 type:complete len:1038 (+) Transcript_6918:2-3115(+)